MIGGKDDASLCQLVIDGATLPTSNNLAGKLNLLDSCALLQHAKRCYVNDSGPMHMASAMNTPTTAFFVLFRLFFSTCKALDTINGTSV